MSLRDKTLGSITRLIHSEGMSNDGFNIEAKKIRKTLSRHAMPLVLIAFSDGN